MAIIIGLLLSSVLGSSTHSNLFRELEQLEANTSGIIILAFGSLSNICLTNQCNLSNSMKTNK